MDRNTDIYGLIQEIVRSETQFLRHYMGEVLNIEDELARGRVMVSIPELNMTAQETAVWAWPRDKFSLSVPTVGDYVEIYFLNGDRNRAVYLGIACEVEDQQLINYESPTTRVIFESPVNSDDTIKYDEEKKQLEIIIEEIIKIIGKQITIESETMNIKGTTEIKLNDGTEPFVLGTALSTWLTSLVTWANSHTHLCAAPGAPSGPGLPVLSSPSGIVSSKIKGA